MALLKSQLPLLTFLTIFSYTAFKYDSRSFKTSKPVTFYCSVIAVLFQGLFWFVSTLTYVSIAASFDKGSEITAMIHLLESWSIEFGLFLILVNALLNHKIQVRLLNKVSRLENMIQVLKLQLNNNLFYKKLQVASNTMIVFMLAYYFVSIIIFEFFLYPDKSLVSQQVSILTVHMIITVLFNLLVVFMISLLKVVTFLFKTLNLNLEQEICNAQSEEIVRILKMHQKLKKTFILFNKSFGIACLGIFLESTGMLTCEVFLDYITLRNFDKYVAITIILYDIVNFCWCLPLIVVYGVLCEECERVTLEAEKTNKILERVHMAEEYRTELQSMVIFG